MDIPIQIPNGTNQILVQVSDPNSYLLILSSFILVLVTLAGVIITGILTRKSNELTRKELDSRMRPWLRIEHLTFEFVILADKTIVTWDEYWNNKGKYLSLLEKISLVTKVTNVGPLPAINATGKFHETSNTISRNTFSTRSEATSPHLLMAGDYFPKHFDISAEIFNKSSEKPYHIGLVVQYEINEKNTKNEVGKIWFVQGNNISLVDSW